LGVEAVEEAPPEATEAEEEAGEIEEAPLETTETEETSSDRVGEGKEEGE
jgi:hypothetical protein